MRATTAFRKLFLRGLAWDAERDGIPLADALKAAAQARLTDTARGKVLIGSASNGTQVNYSLPPIGGLTAEDLADVISDFLDRVDVLVAADSEITDAAIVAALLVDVAPVRSTRPDFTALCRQ